MKTYTVIGAPILLLLLFVGILPYEGGAEDSGKLIFYAILILVQCLLLIAAHEKAMKSGKAFQ